MCKYSANNNTKAAETVNNNAAAGVFSNDNSLEDLDETFRIMEEERVKQLRRGLRKLFTTRVLPVCAKNLNLDEGSTIEIPDESFDDILDDIIDQGEQEPYGVNGGTLVVNVGTSHDNQDTNTTVIHGSAVRAGKFIINPDNVSTFELHLTLVPSTNIKHKMANLVRRFQAKPPLLVVDPKFSLTKKKLYL